MNADLVSKDDIGVYELKFFATFYNSTYEQTAEYYFNLVIYDGDIFVEDGPGKKDDEENVIDENQWDGEIIEAYVPGPFEDDDPVPHLDNVSPLGLVTISWN